MSVSLVKKSLELVSNESQPTSNVSKATKEKRGKKSKRKATPTDDKKNAVITVEKIREKIKEKTSANKTEVNVQRLLNLTKTSVLQKKLERKLLRKVAQKEEKCIDGKKKQKSAFTEEDFAKFEREYFVN